MHEYPKTENLFIRDPDSHKLILGAFRSDEVAMIRDDAWIFTEKIDGTNVRLIIQENRGYDDNRFAYELRGRSNKASLPKDLAVDVSEDRIHALYEQFALDENIAVTLYGEAYGAGIQKGGAYCPEKRTRFFDMVTVPIIDGQQAGRPSWRPWTHVQAACVTLGVGMVPAVPLEGLLDAVGEVQAGFNSIVARMDGGTGRIAEGVVGRTDPYIYDFRGARVFFKLKHEDLKS